MGRKIWIMLGLIVAALMFCGGCLVVTGLGGAGLTLGVPWIRSATAEKPVRLTSNGEPVWHFNPSTSPSGVVLDETVVCLDGLSEGDHENGCPQISFRGMDGRLYDAPTTKAQQRWWQAYRRGDASLEQCGNPCGEPLTEPEPSPTLQPSPTVESQSDGEKVVNPTNIINVIVVACPECPSGYGVPAPDSGEYICLPVCPQLNAEGYCLGYDESGQLFLDPFTPTPAP